MKNFIIKSILAFIILFSFSNVIFAAQTEETFQNRINRLVPKPIETYAKDYEEPKKYASLPDVELFPLITSVIKTVLRLTMSLTIIALVVTGIYFLMAKGDEESLKKGKDVILYLLIGMAIIAASYAVVSGISQFKFFD